MGSKYFYEFMKRLKATDRCNRFGASDERSRDEPEQQSIEQYNARMTLLREQTHDLLAPQQKNDRHSHDKRSISNASTEKEDSQQQQETIAEQRSVDERARDNREGDKD